MSSAFSFDEFGISLVAPISNPQDFYLDSLYRLGIAHPSWQLRQAPIYVPGRIDLNFDRGAILVQPNRVGLLHQQKQLAVASSWILDSARRCLTSFPHLIYEGVGFSLTGHLLIPRQQGQPDVLLRQQLLSSQAWSAVEQVQPCVTLTLTYPLAGRDLELMITEGGSIEQGVMQPAILFRANFAYNVCEEEPEARVLPMQMALDRCGADLELCRSLIEQQCRHLLAGKLEGSRRMRRVRGGAIALLSKIVRVRS